MTINKFIFAGITTILFVTSMQSFSGDPYTSLEAVDSFLNKICPNGFLKSPFTGFPLAGPNLKVTHRFSHQQDGSVSHVIQLAKKETVKESFFFRTVEHIEKALSRRYTYQSFFNAATEPFLGHRSTYIIFYAYDLRANEAARIKKSPCVPHYKEPLRSDENLNLKSNVDFVEEVYEDRLENDINFVEVLHKRAQKNKEEPYKVTERSFLDREIRKLSVLDAIFFSLTCLLCCKKN